jgi:hypothetical protein
VKTLLFAFSLILLGISVDATAGKYPREVVSKIEVPGPFGGSGSAVAIQPGLFLTARHVAEIEGLVAGAVPVVFVGAPKDETMDVAAVKSAAAVCPCAEFADFDARADETVVIVGWPRGIANVAARGESQGVHVVPEIGRRLMVQTVVAGGTSGGGGFVMRDGRWQLVGILAEGSSTDSLLVPISDIRKWLEGRE